MFNIASDKGFANKENLDNLKYEQDFQGSRGT
jgi:hypothetical protein